MGFVGGKHVFELRSGARQIDLAFRVPGAGRAVFRPEGDKSQHDRKQQEDGGDEDVEEALIAHQIRKHVHAWWCTARGTQEGMNISDAAANARENARRSDGKFGSYTLDEAGEIDLSWATGGEDDNAQQERLAKVPRGPFWDDGEDEREMAELRARVYKVSRSIMMSKGVDKWFSEDDLTNETMMTLLKQLGREKISRDGVSDGLIRKIASSIYSRDLQDASQLSSRDVTGRSLFFKEYLPEYKEKIGRELRPGEFEAVAERFRQDYFPTGTRFAKSRPSEHFYATQLAAPMDGGENDWMRGSSALTSHEDGFGEVDESLSRDRRVLARDSLMARLSKVELSELGTLRRDRWFKACVQYQLNGHGEARPPLAAVMTEREAQRLTEALERAGGVQVVANNHLAGGNTDALFMPFGELDAVEKHDVAEMLSLMEPDEAESMYGAAVRRAHSEPTSASQLSARIFERGTQEGAHGLARNVSTQR